MCGEPASVKYSFIQGRPAVDNGNICGLDEAELIEFCRGRIANYKIPKSIDFTDKPLPKTGPGKIAKRRLRDPYWEDEKRKI